jgi:hypothetical protein
MRYAVLAFALLSATAAVAGPNVSCVMRKQDIVVYDREKKETHEEEDWIVDCSIKVNDKVIFSAPLPMLHPATFQEAVGSVEEFRSRKAKEILKAYKP